MTAAIDIYIGTDSCEACREPEMALEHSILKHASVPVNIHFMRAGTPPYDWHLREPGRPKTHTTFTPMRFAIPYWCKAKRAIYLDVDMVVYADIADLWAYPQKKPWCCTPKRLLKREDGSSAMKFKTEVSLIDCHTLREARWYPTLEQMIADPMTASNFARFLYDRQALDEGIPVEWDVLDDTHTEDGKPAKLIHWTDMGTQPWRPFPERFDYDKRPHRCPAAVKAYHDAVKEALDAREAKAKVEAQEVPTG